jgi:hypothetical protein
MAYRVKIINNFFRLSRAITRQLYYLQKDIYCKADYDDKWAAIKRQVKPDMIALKAYKRRWKWSHAHILSENFYHTCSYYSGIHSADLIPPNVYLHSIEPILNNKLMTEAYGEKGSYDKWLKKELLPQTLLKDINGKLVGGNGVAIKDGQSFLQKELEQFDTVIVKPSTDSWGGKNVVVFEKNDDGFRSAETGDDLSFNWLQERYGTNYIVQEFVEQHPFYKRFNPSSFNTFRVYTYKSVRDNKIHVLKIVLRVGKEGAKVDNISSGGVACGINPDGFFYGTGLSRDLERVEALPALPDVKLSEVGKLFMIDEVKQEAIQIAQQMPFSRIIGMDMGVDNKGKVRLIEVNTDNIGVADSQFVNGPFFREFTDEIIEHCQRMKKVDIIKIY